jgi:hypothetical protein
MSGKAAQQQAKEVKRFFSMFDNMVFSDLSGL